MTKKSNRVAELEAENQELTNSWKRAVADYQNLEKRMEVQQGNYIRMASMGILAKLMPIMDDLNRAIAHIEDAGVRMIVKQLDNLLSSEGVVKMEVLGKEFEPEKMECVEIVEGEKGKVMKVVQDGYTMNEMVVRPAKVEVGKGEIIAE